MKYPYKYVPLDVAIPKLQNGDVLLYRGTGFNAWFIRAVTSSPYTHVGLLAKHHDAYGNGMGASVVEFRECRGGREVDLGGEVDRSDGRIDVFRFHDKFREHVYDEINGRINVREKEFRGERVLSIMRRLTGLPYNYKRLICIYAWKLPIIREFLCCCKKGYNDDRIEHLRLSRFICSTAVDYAFNAAGYPLVQNKNTNYMEPADIAMSMNLSYVLTLSHPRQTALEGERVI